MGSVEEQIANLKAFHRLPEKLPGLTIAEWRKLVSGWKARMGVMVTVGDLVALLDAHEALLSEVGRE